MKKEIAVLHKKIDHISKNSNLSNSFTNSTMSSSYITEDIINDIMQSNNEHFNSYDILIPQVEILTIQTNDSIKNIEILKNGFLQFANETKQNVSQIQSQMKEFNDKIKQNLKKIDDWKSNSNLSPVNSNDDLINEYKNEINQNIEDLKNLINNIEDEMKTRKEEIDNVYIKLYIYIYYRLKIH